ncbi:MAG TPA: DUF4249 domain-containing protein [Ohtaekwangia sp.]|nr:DUF4249 domain-containing protein [Ohtaekwangia sp.]
MIRRKVSEGVSLQKGIVSILVTIAFGVASCLPDPLEVTGLPRVRPEIVISSQIIPDGSLVVFVTRTFGALDASDDSDPGDVIDQIAVNDALVTISHHNITDTLLFLGSGVYGGLDIDFVPGTTYTLVVDSETLGVVTASTEAMPQVSFEAVEAELYFDGYDDTLAQVSYVFRDPEERNWYMINVLEIDSSEIVDNILNPRDFTRLVNDNDFEGEHYAETFRVFPKEFDKGDSIAVYLSNISREYYEYLEMRQDNRFGFFEFISEPVNYPSNVRGGRGFFNLYIPDIRLIVLE